MIVYIVYKTFQYLCLFCHQILKSQNAPPWITKVFCSSNAWSKCIKSSTTTFISNLKHHTIASLSESSSDGLLYSLFFLFFMGFNISCSWEVSRACAMLSTPIGLQQRKRHFYCTLTRFYVWWYNSFSILKECNYSIIMQLYCNYSLIDQMIN